MKTEYKVVAVSITFGLLLWIFDAALDALLFYDGTFWGLLIFDVPRHELYIRSLVLGCFVIFGLLISAVMAKRERAEEELRIHADIINSASNAIATTDIDGKMTSYNPIFLKMWGFAEADKILGRPFSEFWMVSDQLDEIMRALLEQGNWTGEIKAKKKDGSLFDVQVSAATVYNQAGQPIRLMSSSVDITERRRTEEKIQQQNEFLNNIIESLADPFYVINAQDYTIQIANSAARNLGVAETATCYALTHHQTTPCDGLEHPCPLAIVQETKEPVVVEHKHFDKAGNPIYMEIHGYPIFNSDGDVVQLIEYLSDITERKQAEEDIKQLYKQTQQDAETKATLLQEVNHRVKNNLAGIVGMLYVTQRYVGQAKAQNDCSSIIEDLIPRIEGLATVHNMLSASKWSPLPLNDLAARIIDTVLQSLPLDKHILVDITPTTSVRVWPKQANSLTMVINELTTNTVKYALAGRPTARVTVRVAMEGETILFEFQDNGPGFPEEVLRLERHNMGLYLIQKLVRSDLRGELTLHNQPGAITTIRFPATVKSGTKD